MLYSVHFVLKTQTIRNLFCVNDTFCVTHEQNEILRICDSDVLQLFGLASWWTSGQSHSRLTRGHRWINDQLNKRDEFAGVLKVKVKLKVHTLQTLDIAPLRSETPPQKCSGMARVLGGSYSFTCTATRSSAIGMSGEPYLPLPSQPQMVLIYRPGGMEGWADLGAK